MKLKQTRDYAVCVNVNPLRGGHLGQSGHGHNVAGLNHDKTGASRHLHLADRDGEALGTAQLSGCLLYTSDAADEL